MTTTPVTKTAVDNTNHHGIPTQRSSETTQNSISAGQNNPIDTVAETNVDEQQRDAKGNKEYKPYAWDKNNVHDTGSEGGYGWFVVLGAFFGYLTSFGTETAWGVIQAHFEKEVFYDIPDVQYQLSFAGTIIGVLVMVLGLELAGFANKIWHLYLTQGIMFGFGASFLYVAAMTVPAQWFNKRRGLGLGVVTSGAGIGGVILPFIVTGLINRVGTAWTYRILGFVYLALNACTCFLVKEKYPSNKNVNVSDDVEEQPSKNLSLSFKEIYDFSILKDPNFVRWMVPAVIGTMGKYTPQFFILSYASYVGLSAEDGSVFSAVLAASSFAFRVPVGFCTTFYTLLTLITVTVVGIEKFPTALSVMMLANIISTMGTNIASAINKSVDSEPYFAYKMYTGVTFAVGALLILGLKYNDKMYYCWVRSA
ncbi:major facilitator superfamily domain-containing protein [Phascolomyces articulosus]|uniref:Major facilitator superfamily domain-containing protein n=1 Tax=Phascolomyces articulosus TaxID=60185 RepID=A0AAD5JQU6_9FUNG|nr:major facilitator superfamily domain-containing protein [Phascolomyces articulosus]